MSLQPLVKILSSIVKKKTTTKNVCILGFLIWLKIKTTQWIKNIRINIPTWMIRDSNCNDYAKMQCVEKFVDFLSFYFVTKVFTSCIIHSLHNFPSNEKLISLCMGCVKKCISLHLVSWTKRMVHTSCLKRIMQIIRRMKTLLGKLIRPHNYVWPRVEPVNERKTGYPLDLSSMFSLKF